MDHLVELYLTDVGQHSEPDAELEALLLRRAREGDEEAARRVMQGFLGRVAQTALTVRRTAGLDARDAIKEANRVLMALVFDSQDLVPPRLDQAVSERLMSFGGQ